jgi:putative intracellular protease/amidase
LTRDEKLKVDLTLDEANPQNFDVIMIPGGTMTVDASR